MGSRWVFDALFKVSFKFKSQDSWNLDQKNNSVVIDFFFFLSKMGKAEIHLGGKIWGIVLE